MSVATADPVATSLNEALRAVEMRRQEYQRVLQDLDAREGHIKLALEGMVLGEQDSAPAPVSNGNNGAPRLSIHNDRLEIVRKYMERKGVTRQVDIGKETGENSGTVSVGLRVLEQQGLVRPGEVRDGSRVWHWISTATQAAQEREHEEEGAAA